MTRYIASALLLLVVIYGVVKAIPLISGPRIFISSIETNDTGLTTISGTAVHTKTLGMDGGTLLIDEAGNFSTQLTFPKGGAILSLTATDRFGRSRMLERSVFTP